MLLAMPGEISKDKDKEGRQNVSNFNRQRVHCIENMKMMYGVFINWYALYNPK